MKVKLSVNTAPARALIERAKMMQTDPNPPSADEMIEIAQLAFDALDISVEEDDREMPDKPY